MIVAPFVSVVIPAFNQADFLTETIQSVLTQTFTDFEIIVVNDASPDHTEAVVKQFHDSRLRYVRHEQNRGLPAARNTGMRAANGEIIALLDADDLFHPQKLQVHVDFLVRHDDIGVSYNNRFNLNHSARTIRDIWRAPRRAGLRDFLLSFPFAPSDMVLRRGWAFEVGLFDESYVCGGEDVDFPLQLALAGCHFGNVDRVLNYRRYHSGRKKKNLSCRIDDYTRALRKVFSDPRCPAQERHLTDKAFAQKYLEVAYIALLQNETELGREFLEKAAILNPAILRGVPCPLVLTFTHNSIMDHNLDHAKILKEVFSQLPDNLRPLCQYCDWAIAQGHLLRGIRDIIWGRFDDADFHLNRSIELNITVDKQFLQNLVYQLLVYQTEFGRDDVERTLSKITPYLTKMGGYSNVRQLVGNFAFAQAFQNYNVSNFAQVPDDVIRAIANEPKHICNRGLLSILFRSIVNLLGSHQVRNEKY